MTDYVWEPIDHRDIREGMYVRGNPTPDNDWYPNVEGEVTETRRNGNILQIVVRGIWYDLNLRTWEVRKEVPVGPPIYTWETIHPDGIRVGMYVRGVGLPTSSYADVEGEVTEVIITREPRGDRRTFMISNDTGGARRSTGGARRSWGRNWEVRKEVPTVSTAWEPIDPGDIEVGMTVKAEPTPDWSTYLGSGPIEGVVQETHCGGSGTSVRIHDSTRLTTNRRWFVARTVPVSRGSELPEWAQVEYALEAGVNLWKKVKEAADTTGVGCTEGVNSFLRTLNLPGLDPVRTPQQFVTKVREQLLLEFVSNSINRQQLDRFLRELQLAPYEEPKTKFRVEATAEQVEILKRAFDNHRVTWEEISD